MYFKLVGKVVEYDFSDEHGREQVAEQSYGQGQGKTFD
jgi:hypothetical protein